MFIIFRTQEWNRLNLHFNDGLEILLSLSEGDHMYINAATYPIKRGSLFVMNNTDFHRSVGDNSKQLYQFYSINFDATEVQGVSTANYDLTECFQDHQHFNHHCQLSSDQLDHLLKLIYRLQYYLKPDCAAEAKDVYSKISLAEILIYINSLYKSSDNISKSKNRLPEKAFPIVQYIQEHYSEDISLVRLADEFFISKSHLSRIFKKMTGVTINAYTSHIRILKAKEFLVKGYSVNIVSEKVGFKSPSHFISTFEKFIGMSPKKYSNISSSSKEFKWGDNY